MQKTDDLNTFDRTWSEFKDGFEVNGGNYWLGNEQIHQLTNHGGYKLRVDIESNDGSSGQTVSYWAEYSTFMVGFEATNYQLLIDGYSGDAGNPLAALNGLQFTSKDRDNDDYSTDNCALYTNGGFWLDGECNEYSCAPTAGRGSFDCYSLPDSNNALKTVQMWLQCK